MKEIDAVSLGMIWDRFISITDEVLNTLVRTSFSTNVRESYDLSCMLFDAKGRMLAQGAYSVPSFTGTAPVTIRAMLDRFPPDTLKSGDVIATNDPWLGTGHLFDINVMRPVFMDGRLIGYTFSITHLPDIGGLGFSAVAKQVYEEGLRIPICKLVEAGQPNKLLFDLIATNVRVPEQTIGDLHANISCNEVGAQLLVEFMREYGIDDLTPLADAIIASSEIKLRNSIKEIPDGSYRNEMQIEGMDDPITLAIRVDVNGDRIHADFSGTSDVIPMGVNVPLLYSKAFVVYAIKCVTTPNIPNNGGSVIPITVSAPENCILNAMPPHPTGGRHVVGHYVSSLVFGALAQAIPERVQAESGMLTLVNVQGQHADGRGVSSIYFASGGYGALNNMDGAPTLPSPSNMTGTPIEVWEDLTGITVRKKALLTDSGGAGKFRGGLGQQIVLSNDSGNDMTVSCLAGRTEFPAQGIIGGKAGGLRRLEINGTTVHPKGRYVLAPGDIMTLIEPGGGGYGNPFDRDPKRVREDVLSGAVSLDAARAEYGVGRCQGKRLEGVVSLK